jgi:hypothetical protein
VPILLGWAPHHNGRCFEVENFLVDAFDLGRVDDPAIEDARLVDEFFSWSLRPILCWMW